MNLAKRPKSGREPTIALINIVFLMLVFFMIAGTLAPPLDASLDLVETSDLEGREPPDTLVIHADGRLSLRGATLTSVAAYVERVSVAAPLEEVRIVPDRALPARELVRAGAELRALGATRVFVVTEGRLQ
ncbi:ExbD/TolR family protein [Falsiruegeria mediterranea]